VSTSIQGERAHGKGAEERSNKKPVPVIDLSLEQPGREKGRKGGKENAEGEPVLHKTRIIQKKGGVPLKYM